MSHGRVWVWQVPGLINKVAPKPDPVSTSPKAKAKAIAKTPAMKRKAPKAEAAASAKSEAKKAKKVQYSPTHLPAGWEVQMKPRPSDPTKLDRAFVAPCGRSFDRWTSVEAFLKA